MKKYYASLKKNCRNIITLIGVICATNPGTIFAEQTTPRDAERMFRGVLTAVLDNRTDTALSIVEKSLAVYPNFRITEILHGDLLTAHAHQKPLIAMPQALRQQRIIGLRDEMLARFTHHLPKAGHLPQSILKLSPYYNFALVLDASQSRLYIFKNDNGNPTLINHYYVSIGNGGMGKTTEGDNKTPTGIYTIVSYLDDNELPELYGVGAYTLNYPNSWDKQSEHDGYGIWIHGIPRQLSSRPPQDSRGCIILENTFIAELRKYLGAEKAPVLLNPKITWLDSKTWRTQRNQLLQHIRDWQHDWESMNIEQYLSHYAPEYKTETQNYRQMLTQARINANKKTFVKVIVENLDLFIHPGQPGLAQIVFDQNYQSNNYNIQYRKQQMWRHTNEGWKIIYEGKT